MQILVKLFFNSLYGENIRKDIEESFACNSIYWKLSEFVGRISGGFLENISWKLFC